MTQPTIEEAERAVAALFVEPDGVYYGLEGVDPWDEKRDARLYRGPHPVVAHPPCGRWGRYWGGGPSVRERRKMGDDEGCFAAALWAVRTFGGVIEHPEASHAWRWFGLPRPTMCGGWEDRDFFGGSSCCVFQGHYGHPAPKATWIYAVLPELPELKWGRAKGRRLDEGFHSQEERIRCRAQGQKPRPRLSTVENLRTPTPFRDLLLSLARSAR